MLSQVVTLATKLRYWRGVLFLLTALCAAMATIALFVGNAAYDPFIPLLALLTGWLAALYAIASKGDGLAWFQQRQATGLCSRIKLFFAWGLLSLMAVLLLLLTIALFVVSYRVVMFTLSNA